MNKEHIHQFNTHVNKENHYELQVYCFSPQKLVLAGGYELDYGHSIELHFTDVHFFCGKQYFALNDPSENPLYLGLENPECFELNAQYSIESGYELFVFTTDEGRVIIAAKEMVLIKRNVLYYKPDNLKEGQEIAYWVK